MARRRDGDIAPYRNGTRVWRAARGARQRDGTARPTAMGPDHGARGDGAGGRGAAMTYTKQMGDGLVVLRRCFRMLELIQ